MAKVRIDTTELEKLGADMTRAKNVLLGRLAERGYQLLRAEVPVETGNLKQGVSAPEVNQAAMRAVLTVSARSARTGGTTAQVFGADGKLKKTVSLKASPAYNYAEAVARGRPKITPKSGRALLIPVPGIPSGEGYLLVGGQVFVVRRSAKATKPNPFDERAATRLSGEAEKIGEAVLRQFV